jgi:hypothetical protein
MLVQITSLSCPSLCFDFESAERMWTKFGIRVITERSRSNFDMMLMASWVETCSVRIIGRKDE